MPTTYRKHFGVPFDANYANVTSLLHMDGTNGSTTFTDVKGLTWTPAGGTAISTAQSLFGGASALFNGSSTGLSGDGSSAFSFGTGDFTIEMSVRFNSVGSDQILYDSRPAFTNGAYPLISNLGSTKKFQLEANAAAVIVGTTVVVTGTWYHVAVCRASGSTRLFVNGTQEGSTYTDSNSYGVGASRPMVGQNGYIPLSYLDGWVDEFRITKGYARYTANFTVPSEAFANRGP